MKKTITAILVIIAAYAAVFVTDRIMISNEKTPVFCLKEENGSNGTTYHGLGYSYEVIPHLVTGKKEHAFYLFGKFVSSNITNEIQLTDIPETQATVTTTETQTTASSESTCSEFISERSNIIVVSSYRNRAWDYQHYGTFIDIDGKVYEFDFSSEEIKTDEDFVTKLEEYYHSFDVSYSQTISNPDLLWNIITLADSVAYNAEITKEPVANDAGLSTVYVLNSQNRLVKLYSNGDYDETNTDPYALEAADLCRML